MPKNESKSSSTIAETPAAPPSDHHYDACGELVRTEAQRKLLAELEQIQFQSKLDRTPKGGEDGRTLARFCRVPPAFVAHAAKLHEKCLEQQNVVDEKKRKLDARLEARAKRAASEKSVAPTMPPPSPIRRSSPNDASVARPTTTVPTIPVRAAPPTSSSSTAVTRKVPAYTPPAAASPTLKEPVPAAPTSSKKKK